MRQFSVWLPLKMADFLCIAISQPTNFQRGCVVIFHIWLWFMGRQKEIFSWANFIRHQLWALPFTPSPAPPNKQIIASFRCYCFALFCFALFRCAHWIWMLFGKNPEMCFWKHWKMLMYFKQICCYGWWLLCDCLDRISKWKIWIETYFTCKAKQNKAKIYIYSNVNAPHKNMDFRILGWNIIWLYFSPRQCSRFVRIVFVAFTSLSFHFYCLFSNVPIYYGPLKL